MTVLDLGLGEDRNDVDFGVVGDASLGGTVWNDRDGDGVIDPGESGVPNVTVIVTWEGPNGPVAIPVVTGSDGTWNLPKLPPGRYDVELDDTTIPRGTTPTTPTDVSVSVPVGGREVVDIGIAEEVSLGSTVWIDDDGDGTRDAGELGIAGVAVSLYDNLGRLVAGRFTDPDGNCFFTGLAPGTYRIELDRTTLPDKLRATYDRDGTPDLLTTVTLLSGASNLDANFGFQVGRHGPALTLPVSLSLGCWSPCSVPSWSLKRADGAGGEPIARAGQSSTDSRSAHSSETEMRIGCVRRT